MNWSEQEVIEIVNDYFQMLRLEINGIKYSKAQHRRKLAKRLRNRSEGSIEFKHQNISAVLIIHGYPYILGYKPRFNYQKLLEESILGFISLNPSFDQTFDQFIIPPLEEPVISHYSKLVVDPPSPPEIGNNILQKNLKPKIRKPNYLELEQNNIILGEQGEELIFNYEKWRLNHCGKANLADNIEWISKEQGDGFGFDILSRNIDGTDRYIEVKTTKLGELTPIYFTRNELRFSQLNHTNYYLYRVFQYRTSPKFFTKKGALDHICKVEPTNFIGRF